MPISPELPRVVRKHKPKGKLTRSNYRKRALGPLLLDFERRCAYSMQHERNAGGETAMDIDHFDPRKKKEYLQTYENLFLASRNCNGKKGPQWPDAGMQKRGIRFLDCCKEADYGAHIFEDSATHEVFGVTPAGRYHVRVLDLNSPALVHERVTRFNLHEALNSTLATFTKTSGTFHQFQRVLALLRIQMAILIPLIPTKVRTL